ncbi:ML domain-containing protein [Umbelopsis sp. PMI_123]|nr:ML domain-containing protein [Umbelopsis sp. PMI_123]
MRSILLLSLLAAAANAAVLPAFRVQEVGQTLSTDLITNCGNDNDILSIDYINLTPDPPVKGETLDIEFKGWLSEEVVNGSYIDLTVKFGVVKLLQKRLDLCDQAKEIDTQCPIPAGEFTFTKSVDLPKEIPGGKYTVNAKINLPDEREITCLNGVATFPRQRFGLA